MKACPNCGQDVSAVPGRFCPYCGYQLPPARSGAAGRAPGAGASQAGPQPPYQQVPDPGASVPPGYGAPLQPQQAPYAQPDPNAPPATGYTPNGYAPAGYPPNGRAQQGQAYRTPTYISGGVSGANLPAPQLYQAPTPVAPAQGPDPAMNTLMGLGRALATRNTRNMVLLAAAVLVIIVAAIVLFKVVVWFLSILPWLLLAAAIICGVYLWQRTQRRGRRLP